MLPKNNLAETMRVWYNVSQLEDCRAGATLTPPGGVWFMTPSLSEQFAPQALTFDDVLHSVFMAKEAPNCQLPQ
jgi:hypothetical protein